MATITVLPAQTFPVRGFFDTEHKIQMLGDNTATWAEQTIEVNTEYIVTWGNGMKTQDYSTYMRQGNQLYLGNLSIYNKNGEDTGEPFFITIITYNNKPTNIALFLTNDLSAQNFLVEIKRNIDNNIVLQDPRGNPVTYGEYDIVLFNTAGGEKLAYYRLPEVNEADNGKVLMATGELWEKANIPQSDWTQTNINASDYIKNKPVNLATIQYVQQQIATVPKQAQADWTEKNTEAPSYILHKPTIPDPQIPSDWEQSNKEAVDYIKNIPEAMKHNSDLVEGEQLVLMDTAAGWTKQAIPQLLMTVTFEDETVKNYYIMGAEVTV